MKRPKRQAKHGCPLPLHVFHHILNSQDEHLSKNKKKLARCCRIPSLLHGSSFRFKSSVHRPFSGEPGPTADLAVGLRQEAGHTRARLGRSAGGSPSRALASPRQRPTASSAVVRTPLFTCNFSSHEVNIFVLPNASLKQPRKPKLRATATGTSAHRPARRQRTWHASLPGNRGGSSSRLAPNAPWAAIASSWPQRRANAPAAAVRWPALVLPLSGQPVSRGGRVAGVALALAYPELARVRRCRLGALAVEVGGVLGALEAPAWLRPSVVSAFVARWSAQGAAVFKWLPLMPP